MYIMEANRFYEEFKRGGARDEYYKTRAFKNKPLGSVMPHPVGTTIKQTGRVIIKEHPPLVIVHSELDAYDRLFFTLSTDGGVGGMNVHQALSKAWEHIQKQKKKGGD